jgi:uncharacterized membrane protein YdcZ (DUF606 family)
VDNVGIAHVDDPDPLHRQIVGVILVVIGAAMPKREQRRGFPDRSGPKRAPMS